MSEHLESVLNYLYAPESGLGTNEISSGFEAECALSTSLWVNSMLEKATKSVSIAKNILADCRAEMSMICISRFLSFSAIRKAISCRVTIMIFFSSGN